jgi:hypothetical protein
MAALAAPTRGPIKYKSPLTATSFTVLKARPSSETVAWMSQSPGIRSPKKLFTTNM